MEDSAGAMEADGESEIRAPSGSRLLPSASDNCVVSWTIVLCIVVGGVVVYIIAFLAAVLWILLDYNWFLD